MKRYFVKVVAEAKETNPNFRGVVHEYLFGKKDEMLLFKTNEETPLMKPCDLIDVFGLEYGFKTLPAAKKAASSHDHEEKYWSNEVSVIEMDVTAPVWC